MYINTDTLEYPVSELQIKDQFTNTSFPSEFVPPQPYEVVFGTAEPDYDQDTQRIEQDSPVLNDGKWKQSWRIVELTEQEKQARQQLKYASASQSVRSDRDALLRASDWTQLNDTPGEVKAAYVQYRQALRDVPSQAGFPWNVTWPIHP